MNWLRAEWFVLAQTGEASSDPSTFERFLLPAMVAAVVTLLIEYLAKPGLEVRKQRILDERHAVVELREARAVRDARLWPLFRLGMPWDVDRTPSEIDRALGAASEMVEALAKARTQIAIEVLASVRPVVLDTEALLSRVRRSFDDGTWQAQIGAREVIQDSADAILKLSEYLDLPRWKWRKRREALRYSGDRMAP